MKESVHLFETNAKFEKSIAPSYFAHWRKILARKIDIGRKKKSSNFPGAKKKTANQFPKKKFQLF